MLLRFSGAWARVPRAASAGAMPLQQCVAAAASSAAPAASASRLLHTSRMPFAQAQAQAAPSSTDAAATRVLSPAAARAAMHRASAERRARQQRRADAHKLRPKIAAPTGPRLLQRQRARLHWAAHGVGLAKAPAPVHYPTAHLRGQIMNRSFRGIFAGVHVHFGNMVSHSTRRTRRTWMPNVHRMRLDSQVLNRSFHLPCSTRALRTFEKYGGVDRYLLRQKLHRLDQGITRELRTAMELTLLNYPEVAKELHLEDVLARVQSKAETARLRAIEAERAAILARTKEPGASPLPRLAHLARVRDSPEEVERQRVAAATAAYEAGVIAAAEHDFWYPEDADARRREVAEEALKGAKGPRPSTDAPHIIVSDTQRRLLLEKENARIDSFVGKKDPKALQDVVTLVPRNADRRAADEALRASVRQRAPSYEFPFYQLKGRAQVEENKVAGKPVDTPRSGGSAATKKRRALMEARRAEAAEKEEAQADSNATTQQQQGNRRQPKKKE